MTLTVTERKRAARILAREMFSSTSADMDSLDLLAAVDAVDDWTDANQPSFIAALPEPFKAKSTATEKAKLLNIVTTLQVG